MVCVLRGAECFSAGFVRELFVRVSGRVLRKTTIAAAKEVPRLDRARIIVQYHEREERKSATESATESATQSPTQSPTQSSRALFEKDYSYIRTYCT